MTRNELNRQKHFRIAQLITGSNYIGGAETHVRELTAGLQSCGHECTVLCGPPDGLFCAQLRAQGVRVRIIRALRKPLSLARDPLALGEVIRELRRVRPDIVAAHTAKACFLGRLAAAALRVPSVVTPHGLSIINRETGELSKTFVALERFVGIFGNKVITVCKYERKLAETAGIVDTRKLAVVHNGVGDDLELADPAREPACITMIARFERPKDHETIVRALAEVKDCSGWTARLIGAGSRLHETRGLVARLGIEARVEFAGECSNTASALAASQIFVLSTQMEAFPISILEAMRAGLPVVASDVGGISEAVEDQVTGLLTPATDHIQLAGRMRALLMDPERRRRMGRNGRIRYLNNFTAARMVEKTLGVYFEALSEGAGAQAPVSGWEVEAQFPSSLLGLFS
jgi:glycosyltransferase involved in cell wall biosynthesis